MKATVSPISQRIALKLDLSIAFEALILNRLRRLPESRRKEWLRGLLVQGFQSECRALRKLQRAGQTGADEPCNQNVATRQSLSAVDHRSPVPRPKTSPQAEPAVMKAHDSGNTVSFAALRKVIG